jgi:uncharacterized protein YaaN involved in tellurite resistance
MEDHAHRSDPAQPAGSDASWAIDPAQAERVERTVAEYVETAASLDPGGQRFLRTVATIDRLGQREFTAAAAMSARTLERRLDVERGLLTAKAPLAHQLSELRKLVDELNPARIGLGRKRSRGPFGLGAQRDELNELADYFERFTRSQDRVEAILQTLAEGRFALERDSALLGQEQVSLAAVMETLRENAYLTGRLDVALAARIDVIARADPERADCLRSDLLYAIRRRRQEILTQLAVAMQGYASLQILDETNEEMARAIATATTTTAAALRTAVMVAHAVAGQRMALEQMEAAAAASGAMADDAKALLERQSAAVRSVMADAGSRVALLQHAWDDIFGALDRVDVQKEEALRTITSADRQATQSAAGSADGPAGPVPGD